MSDKTFGVKVSEELYERVKQIVDVSGASTKDWFEKMVALSEIQSIKEGSVDFKQDLSELELHTTRIYELVANMIQRANYLKEDALKGLENKLESKELTISELQNAVKGLKENLTQLEEVSKQSEEEKQSLTEQVGGLRSTNENNQALIQEYKEKIDTLSSLVNQYRGYAEENESLKQTFSAEKEKMKSEFEERENLMASGLAEANSSIKDLERQIEQMQEQLSSTEEKHTNEIAGLKVNHSNQLTQLTDRKELEKERAVLDIERKYQAKLEEAHEQYNNKLASLYEKLDRN